MSDDGFRWRAPLRKSERTLGVKRWPKVECPSCGDEEMTVFCRSKTDWSETHLLERFNPFEPTPKRYRLRWNCYSCGFADQYYVDDNPLNYSVELLYNPDGNSDIQSHIDQF